MNIWLIISGEPLEQFGERPHRIGMLSKMLIQKDHDVTWWTTTYDHQYKKYFFDENKELKNDFGVNMAFLHAITPYKKNISLSRIKNHKEVAESFKTISRKKQKPDIIFCAFPTIDLAYEAIKYAKKYNVPIIIDIRDLWPRIFFDAVPNIIHPLLKIFLHRYIKQTKFIFKNSNFLTAVSEKYLDYGLMYAKRKKTKVDKVFPLAYQPFKINNEESRKYEQKFRETGIDKNKKIVWFVGTFGRTYDLTLPIKVAKRLADRDEVQFVFTGDGENATEWKRLANKLDNVVFTGWVNQNELAYLSSIVHIGLMAYKKGAPQGLPNKIFEYMASGLPILSSLEGETKNMLEEHKIGLSYQADNVEDLQKKLEILLQDKVYTEMSSNCLELFNKKYSANIVYGELIQYFEMIIK